VSQTWVQKNNFKEITMAHKKVAFVTGSSRGIGAAIARRLGENGYDLVLHGRKPSPQLDEVKRCLDKLSVAHATVYFDLNDIRQGDVIAAEVFQKFGRVDCVVSNAGAAPLKRGDFLDLGVDALDFLYRSNLRGPFLINQALAKYMMNNQKNYGSSFIFITSSNAHAVSIQRTDYCMFKAAASMMAKAFAVRLAEAGISVYEIRPGLIYTDMTKGVKEYYDKKLQDGFSLNNRWGVPDDVARAVGSIASGDFAFSTGSIFYVDGGLFVPHY
jgi:3-oxoacyl-[acyl-carrier protein] reductase